MLFLYYLIAGSIFVRQGKTRRQDRPTGGANTGDYSTQHNLNHKSA